MSLIVVKPLAITDAMLTFTDVPEADYPVIAASTAYVAAVGRVISTTKHKIYQCTVSYTSAATPIQPDVDTGHWEEVSATNRWKPFDASSSTQMTQAATATYTIVPGQAINVVGIRNAVADSVRIQLTDPVAGTVFDQTYNMRGDIHEADYYAYFFDVPVNNDQITELHIPPYVNATLVITLSVVTGSVACGVACIGYQMNFGMGIKFGARAGISDYSTKTVNKWGDTVLNPLLFADKCEWALDVSNTQVDAFKKYLTSVRATLCLWVGFDGLNIATLFGFYEDFEIIITYLETSSASITLQGVA